MRFRSDVEGLKSDCVAHDSKRIVESRATQSNAELRRATHSRTTQSYSELLRATRSRATQITKSYPEQRRTIQSYTELPRAMQSYPGLRRATQSRTLQIQKEKTTARASFYLETIPTATPTPTGTAARFHVRILQRLEEARDRRI
jgi:hypothetical protein